MKMRRLQLWPGTALNSLLRNASKLIFESMLLVLARTRFELLALVPSLTVVLPVGRRLPLVAMYPTWPAEV